MSDEANDVTIHGYPPIPSEIPTTKDGWRQRAIGLKLRLSAGESQNQALQREVENKAAILNAIEALLDVDDEHTGWDRIVALQERAEKAEAALRRIASMSPSASQAGWFIAVGIAKNALSPTQETDEPDCTRCGNERTVGGYGIDERSPCPVCRPTQETDPE